MFETLKQNRRGDGADPEIISYRTMLTITGVLAVLLPFLVMGSYILIGCHYWHILDSISEYYYTCSRNIFVGTLCMEALFFIAYKGYNELEDILFNIAAVLCICIAIFPMDPAGFCCPKCFTECFNNNLVYVHHTYTGVMHTVSASLLFIFLGIVSTFLFTIHRPKATGLGPTPEKKKRNVIYRICGITIFVFITGYAIYSGFNMCSPNLPWVKFLTDHNVLFFVEMVCLVSFGVSWLVKGETLGIWNDKEPVIETEPDIPEGD